MRPLRLVAAFIALALSPQIWPAWAASTGAFTVSCGSTQAGSDITCSVSRTSGGKGVYVLFQTSDGTAKSGTDYTAVSQLLYFKASAISQTVAIHTAVNPNATGTLTFTASIAASIVVARATGSIVEPAPVPAPTPTPTPAPSPSPTPSPITSGILTATKNCSSLWRNARTDAANIVLPSVVAGQKYLVTAEPAGDQSGLVPNNLAGPFVIALPIGGTDSGHGDYEFDPSCFQ